MKRRAIVLTAVLLALLSVPSYAQSPVPFINLPLMPDATAPGGADFLLTVNGTGFVSNSTVNWNGNALATQFVNASRLTATVPAADIATASTAWVTVANPAPGGGRSSTVFFTVTPNMGNAVDFKLYSSLFFDPHPGSVAVGDFNGDGNLDLAAGDFYEASALILLGDGKGNFTLVSTLPTSGESERHAVAVGDFNGDGNLDLAFANKYSYNVSVFLGDGTGNFTLVSSPFAWDPESVAVADLNGDGKLDLVTAGGWGSNVVCILLGDGTGNFTLAVSLPAGNYPREVAIGDFNRDGKLDLVTANYADNTVSILLGDGTGNFTLASSPPAGYEPESVAVGDFNGDGKLDLAVANYQRTTVSILMGDGTGNFTLASSAVGSWPLGVALGDFNGDNNLDLAVANWGDSTAYVDLGDGAGNFSLISNVPLGVGPYTAAVGDFNGDGKLDLVTAGSGYLTIVLGVPGAPAVTLYPASLTFETQLIRSTSKPQYVTMSNTGHAPLDITSLVSSADFPERNDCGSSLAPGAQCTIGVAFKPHAVGTITGTITITDNAPDSPQTVSLTGVGTAMTLLPSSLGFGNQLVGTTSQPQIVTLTNYAPKAVTISGGKFAGNNPNSFELQNTTCGNRLPAGESCTASIAFTPHSKGQKTATFEVYDNGGPSPQTVALSGTGTK